MKISDIQISNKVQAKETEEVISGKRRTVYALRVEYKGWFGRSKTKMAYPTSIARINRHDDIFSHIKFVDQLGAEFPDEESIQFTRFCENYEMYGEK